MQELKKFIEEAEYLLNDFLLVSLTISLVIVLLFLISPLLHRRYGAKWNKRLLPAANFVHCFSQPPAFSMGFSGSGKNAGKIFANIFDRKNKKKGVWTLVLFLALAGASGTMVACDNGQISPGNNAGQGSTNNLQASVNNQQAGAPDQLSDYAEQLYQCQGTGAGDNAKVAAIVRVLNFIDLPVKSIELETDSEPYWITVNYLIDSRANYRLQAGEQIIWGWHKNAAVMFSLIPDAGEISFRIHDPYGDFAGAYYNREDLSERGYGMEYFTADTLKGAADSLESFTDYLSKVEEIKDPGGFYSEGQKQSREREKQIYALIGDDREITVNSGVGFSVTITDAFAANPPIKELADQKERFAPYTGKQIAFLIYQIRNFKTDDASVYLFVFDDGQMIANVDLQTADARRNAIGTLNALQGENQ